MTNKVIRENTTTVAAWQQGWTQTQFCAQEQTSRIMLQQMACELWLSGLLPWDGAFAVHLPHSLQLCLQVGTALRANVNVVNVKDGPAQDRQMGDTRM